MDEMVYNIFVTMMYNIYIVVPSLLLYICSTIKLNTKYKINKWKKNTKPCRGTKIARNAVVAETNDPGSCHEPGPMIHHPLAAHAPTWRPIGPGLC
jgi:hypothetical protein